MKTAAVTGATGFIGAAVCAVLRARGWRVVRLGRKLATTGDDWHWQLGEPIPIDLRDVDCVIHLASATLVARRDIAAAAARDLDGARVLVGQFRAQCQTAGRRFIFVSSQSARADAANHYGRVKWQVEQLMNEPGELIVRPGLVFGQAEATSFGQVRAIVRKSRILPDLCEAAAIHPIHVDDLALAIALIAEHESPQKLWLLGHPQPMQIKELFAAVAQRERLRPPTFVKFPAPLARFGARVVDFILRPVPSFSERVDGLIGLLPFEPTPSLQALRLELRPLVPREQSC